jgi:hypothetical protein
MSPLWREWMITKVCLNQAITFLEISIRIQIKDHLFSKPRWVLKPKLGRNWPWQVPSILLKQFGVKEQAFSNLV